MKKILFISDRLLEPARLDGLTIRYFPLIKGLTADFKISFMLIGKREALAKNSELKYENVFVVDPEGVEQTTKVKKINWVMRYLNPFSYPNTMYKYGSEKLAKKILATLDGYEFDSIVYVWQQYLISFYIIKDRLPASQLLIDFVDSPLLIFDRNFGGDQKSFFYRVERFKVKRWENKICRDFDGGIYISSVDAFYASKKAASLGRYVVKNGVYLEDCDLAVSDNKTFDIGFVGNMAYGPNIEAVKYLYQMIFKPLRAVYPHLTMAIVGRHPNNEILALGKNGGVTITGEVENIPSYIRSFKVAVFPMLSGGGVQNKVLDAMLLKVPVVTTSIGNEGIDAVSGDSILLADSDAAIRESVVSVIEDPLLRSSLALSGFEFVEHKFSWDRIIEDYRKILCQS